MFVPDTPATLVAKATEIAYPFATMGRLSLRFGPWSENMPIFEYKCRRCGHVTSFLEKPGTKGPHKCEQCGSSETDKTLSVFAAQTGASSDSGSRCASAATCPSGTCPLKR